MALVQHVGDRHLASGALKVSLEKAGHGPLFLKYGECVPTERFVCEFLVKLSQMTEVRNLVNLVTPEIVFDTPSKILLKPFIEGLSYKAIESWDYASEQLDHFLWNVEAIASVEQSIIDLANSGPKASVSVARKLTKIMEHYPDNVHLRAALAHHFSIQLPGEGYRGLVELVSTLCNVKLPSSVRYNKDKVTRCRRLCEAVFGGPDWLYHEKLEALHKQLGYYKYIVDALSIYDAHTDNMLIFSGQDGPKLILTDFECLLGGTSQAMFPSSLRALTKAASNLSIHIKSPDHYASIAAQVSEELFSSSQVREATKEFLLGVTKSTSPALKKRVIYVGSRLYASIIKNFKELLWICAMLPISRIYQLDFSDHPDLASFPTPIQHYQLWKRYFRGLCNWPSEIPAEVRDEAQLAEDYLLQYPNCRPAGAIARKVAEHLTELKQLKIDIEINAYVLEKTFRSLTRLPHRLFFPQELASDVVEVALQDIIHGRPLSCDGRLGVHLKELVHSILALAIPHHTLPLCWPNTVSECIIEDALVLWGEMDDNELHQRAESIGKIVMALWNQENDVPERKSNGMTPEISLEPLFPQEDADAMGTCIYKQIIPPNISSVRTTKNQCYSTYQTQNFQVLAWLPGVFLPESGDAAQ